MGIGALSVIDLCNIKTSANNRLLKKYSYINEKITDIENKAGNATNLIKFPSNPCVDSWLASENKCTDGADDGKIGFFSKVGNFFEGMAKTVVGGAKNFFSDPKKVAKTALIGAGLFVLSCFPPVGTAIAATIAIAGGVKLIANGVKTIKEGVQNAKSATTDAAAKDAWEQIGNGSLKTGVGVVVAVKGGSELYGSLSTPVAEGTAAGAVDTATEISNEALADAANRSIFDPTNYIDD